MGNDSSDTREVTDPVEKRFYLGSMFRFTNETIFPAVDSAILANERLVAFPTAWYELNLKNPLTDEMAQKWASSHGEWKHGTGNSGEHNRLGMAYAWWVTYEVGGLLNINLGDSPDFRGTILLHNERHKENKVAKVCGDIGKCSFLAFNNGFMNLGFHSCWISVLNPQKQILVEFGYNPEELHRRSLFGAWWARREDPTYSSADDLREIFYCEECKSWSVTEDSLQRIGAEWDREAKESRHS